MSRYIEFLLPDGTTIIMEGDDAGSEVVKAGRWAAPITERVQETFEQALEKAQRAAAIVAEKVRTLQPHVPQQVEVTFGLKASGELGTLVVAKAAIEASYSIKLVWKTSEPGSNGARA